MLRKILVLSLLLSQINSALASCIGLNCTCTVATSTLAFGNYAPLSGNPVAMNGTVAVTCSALLIGATISYSIYLSTGSSGSFATRTMKLGTKVLNYNIYTNSALTAIWGDGSSGTSTITDGYLLDLLSVTKTYTMYGRIPASQTSVSPGTYTDTITMTVSY